VVDGWVAKRVGGPVANDDGAAGVAFLVRYEYSSTRWHFAGHLDAKRWRRPAQLRSGHPSTGSRRGLSEYHDKCMSFLDGVKVRRNCQCSFVGACSEEPSMLVGSDAGQVGRYCSSTCTYSMQCFLLDGACIWQITFAYRHDVCG
jgi:hypothetical protein